MLVAEELPVSDWEIADPDEVAGDPVPVADVAEAVPLLLLYGPCVLVPEELPVPAFDVGAADDLVSVLDWDPVPLTEVAEAVRNEDVAASASTFTTAWHSLVASLSLRASTLISTATPRVSIAVGSLNPTEEVATQY